jgi:acyl-CoA thioesterase I
MKNNMMLFALFTLLMSVIYVTSIRITCIGDSITQGGACTPHSYTDVLQTLVGTDHQVINAGISAKTMLKKGLCNDMGDCSYWNTDSWPQALKSNPDVVTIMLGTNDAKSFNWEGIQQNLGDYFALDYVDMVRIIRQLKPAPKIYLVVPPPLYEPYPFEMNQTIINKVYPNLIRDIAKAVDANFIDVYSTFTRANQTCDGCHPTAEGNNLIASAIHQKLLDDKIIKRKAAEEK